MSDCIGTGCKADSLMERIAALEAERADLIKINNGWAHEWDAMREERDALAKDAARFEWLRRKISGAEYRRLGVVYSDSGMIREAIDAAREKP